MRYQDCSPIDFFPTSIIQFYLAKFHNILGENEAAKHYLEQAYPRNHIAGHLFHDILIKEDNIESQKKAYIVVCDLLKRDPLSPTLLHAAGRLLDINSFFSDSDKYLKTAYNYYVKAGKSIPQAKIDAAFLLLNHPSLYNNIPQVIHQKIRNILAKVELPQALYILGHVKVKEEKFEDALQLFIASNTDNSKYIIGQMYDKGYIGGELSEQERLLTAYSFFKDSTLDDAKYDLALLYFNSKSYIYSTLEEKAHQAIEILEPLVLKGHKNAESLLNNISKAMEKEEQNKKPLQEAQTTDEIVLVPDINFLSLTEKRLASLWENTPLKKMKPNRKSTEKRQEKFKKQVEQLRNINKEDNFSVISNSSRPKEVQKIEIVFAETVQQQLLTCDLFLKQQFTRMIEEIKEHKWKTTGIGQPEVLKYIKGNGAILSRRLNQEDRLVYSYNAGTLTIYSFIGHY